LQAVQAVVKTTRFFEFVSRKIAKRNDDHSRSPGGPVSLRRFIRRIPIRPSDHLRTARMNDLIAFAYSHHDLVSAQTAFFVKAV
jgi:hypothetical protein